MNRLCVIGIFVCFMGLRSQDGPREFLFQEQYKKFSKIIEIFKPQPVYCVEKEEPKKDDNAKDKLKKQQEQLERSYQLIKWGTGALLAGVAFVSIFEAKKLEFTPINQRLGNYIGIGTGLLGGGMITKGLLSVFKDLLN